MRFYFGDMSHDAWTTDQPNLRRAIRAFRVGCLWPHAYSTAPNWEDYPQPNRSWGKTARSSQPGAVVRVQSSDRVLLAEIPPEGTAEEESLDLPHLLQAAEGHAAVDHAAETGLQLRSGEGLPSLGRTALQDREVDINTQLLDLQRMQQELQAQMVKLQAEVKRRMEQVWLIELFLGSHEEVHVLRQGAPAPADTRISVRQRILCMDEEIAVHDFCTRDIDPGDRFKFDVTQLSRFDEWLTSPGALETICPWPKGIVGLRVRRKPKHRESPDIRTALGNAELAMADVCTYLLVRNGEQLYRLWVDVDLWPRFFARASEWDFKEDPNDPDKRLFPIDRSAQVRQAKQFAAGLMMLTGLCQRSEVFHPLPHPKIDAFNPEHVAAYFDLIADDEGALALGDGTAHEHVTWDSYQKWLREQLAVGVRVLWTGKVKDYGSNEKVDPLWSRTGWVSQRLSQYHHSPSWGEVYTLESGDGSHYNAPFTFLYTPREYRKRFRFACFQDEVLPIDMLSWRVLEHLIRDRNQREEYGEFFYTAFKWRQFAKREAALEAPFVDLVVQQLGGDVDRARVERLLRWWKLKVKVHRTVAVDDAKALRMIVAAYQRGDDHANDPETLLGRST